MIVRNLFSINSTADNLQSSNHNQGKYGFVTVLHQRIGGALLVLSSYRLVGVITNKYLHE